MAVTESIARVLCALETSLYPQTVLRKREAASKWGTIVEKTLEVPYWTAPMTLRNTPLVIRLQER